MRSKSAGVLAVSAAAAILWGCGGRAQHTATVTGGDAGRGRAAIGKYGCGSCHTMRESPRHTAWSDRS